jgi:hypothetical protein
LPIDFGRSKSSAKAPSSPHDRRHRQERLEDVAHRDRPAAGPPPPCGCENVLCRLMCTMSKPMSPGREMPQTALRFAPS